MTFAKVRSQQSQDAVYGNATLRVMQKDFELFMVFMQ